MIPCDARVRAAQVRLRGLLPKQGGLVHGTRERVQGTLHATALSRLSAPAVLFLEGLGGLESRPNFEKIKKIVKIEKLRIFRKLRKLEKLGTLNKSLSHLG